MTKNLMGKTRPVTAPYETWITNGWTYKVLKFYKSRDNTISDAYGRVFCEVDGFERELGDVYYSEILTGALIDTNYP